MVYSITLVIGIRYFEKVAVDLEYLISDLTFIERIKVLNGNKHALKRAKQAKLIIENLASEIEHMYFIAKKNPETIAKYLFNSMGRAEVSEQEKQATINFIEVVIHRKGKD